MNNFNISRDLTIPRSNTLSTLHNTYHPYTSCRWLKLRLSVVVKLNLTTRSYISHILLLYALYTARVSEVECVL